METYQFRNGSWYAVTTDFLRSKHGFGNTELEALGELCDRLCELAETCAGYPEEWI